MSENVVPRWLQWAREIQALAQTGYHYAENEFQRERNQRLVQSGNQIQSLNEQLGRKILDRDSELSVVRAELERERADESGDRVLRRAVRRELG